MRYVNLIAIDIAKHVFQVLLMIDGKVKSNRQLGRSELKRWLARQKPSLVVMESCGGAQYWARLARSLGHESKMIDAKRVRQFRQGQKTDRNDVIAICDAAQSAHTRLINGMSEYEQGLQTVDRMRSLMVDQRRDMSNMLRGLLNEFGIVIKPGSAAFKCRLPQILEDMDNQLSVEMREGIAQMVEFYRCLDRACDQSDQRVESLAKADPVCQKLMKLEGIGPMGSIKVRTKLRSGDFKSSRQFSAYIGSTPRQHSSGEKVKIGSICHRTQCDSDLRSTVFLGARSVVSKLKSRSPKTNKERWLKGVLDRRGVKCAAMALVNKNMRTAFALYKNNTDYQVKPLAV